MRQAYHQPLRKLYHRKNTGTEYNLSVFRKIRNLFSEIQGDFVSCKNRARFLLKSSPIDKRILAIGLVIVFIFAILSIPNPNDVLLYFLKTIFVCVITFIILTLSDTFWFLRKKSWSFKLIVKNRKCIQDTLKKIKALDLKEEDHPIGEIYLIAHFDLVGYKYHMIRNGIEISILLTILFFTFPSFFIFNAALFCMMFFYVMLYEHQVSNQVWQDIMTLTNSVKALYKEDPENCRKFIMENDSSYIHELENIYRTIINSVEK